MSKGQRLASKEGSLLRFTALSMIAPLSFLVLGLSGCATSSSNSVSTTDSPYTSEPPEIEESRVIEIAGVRLENTEFDIPIVVNSHVERWVEYFTTRGRPHFQTYLDRGAIFIPYLTEILKEEGMPQDLVYLSMIESGFNIRAYSRARAVGAWQFIAPTGRRYGLRIDWWVDERRDIAKSTRAAVAYLKTLYQHFGSWELATAAYNAGEYKVARAIRRFGSLDFWTLIRHRFLRPETRNYVPKMMAAAIVAKNWKQFGFTERQLEENHQGEARAPDGSWVKVEESSHEDVSDSLALLEAYREDYSDGHLPANEVDPDDSDSHTPHMTKSGEAGGERLSEFEVESPADLLQIAKAAGVTYRTVKKLNPEVRRWVTPPGSVKHRVRLPSRVRDRFLVHYNHPAFPREVEFREYRVRKGDTIRRIARRFRIGQTGIADLNGMKRSARLRVGQGILLPMPADRERSIASLDLRDPPRRRRYHRKRQKKTNVKVTYQQKASKAASTKSGI